MLYAAWRYPGSWFLAWVLKKKKREFQGLSEIGARATPNPVREGPPVHEKWGGEPKAALVVTRATLYYVL